MTSKTAASTMLRLGDYGTLNVTSSKPDSFLYMIDTDSNSKLGGNVFCVNGVNAFANLGGVVTLEGNNVFGAGLGYSAELLDNGTEKVAARTWADCVLVQGGVNYWRYDNVGNFNKYEETLLGFSEIYDFVLPENTYKCTWKYDN